MTATASTTTPVALRTSDRIFRATFRSRNRPDQIGYVVFTSIEDRGDAATLYAGWRQVWVAGHGDIGSWGYGKLPRDGASFSPFGLVALEDTGRRTSELPKSKVGPPMMVEASFFRK